MSLIEVKNYLQKVRLATVSHLAQFFQVKPQMVRCLLQHLVMTGKVRVCTKNPACGTKCGKCPKEMLEIYEWLEVKAAN